MIKYFLSNIVERLKSDIIHAGGFRAGTTRIIHLSVWCLRVTANGVSSGGVMVILAGPRSVFVNLKTNWFEGSQSSSLSSQQLLLMIPSQQQNCCVL